MIVVITVIVAIAVNVAIVGDVVVAAVANPFYHHIPLI